MIFPSFTRTDFDIKKRRETNYEFLNRSAWKLSELVREKVNSWGNTFEVDDEFIRMFKSKSDKQHYSAAFELLVYTLFKNSGFHLIRHPNVGTDKKPDFKASLDPMTFFMECTLSGNSFESLQEKNQKEAIEEIIEEIEYFPYYINVDFRKTSDQSISQRRFRKFLAELIPKSEGISNEVLLYNKHSFEDNGWKLEITLARKPNIERKRSLGYITQAAKVIDTSKPIMTALNDKKPSRYGVENEPYIICLNTSDLFTKETCFGEALFGQYGDDKIDLRYPLQNGFFLCDKAPINTTVTAVIIFRNFDLFTLDSSTVAVWHNPFAKNRIEINHLPFKEYVFEKEGEFLVRKVYEKEKDLFQLLALDKDTYLIAKEKNGS